jgi:sn-glycerol 3-phosphate transport system substrate-binding protein
LPSFRALPLFAIALLFAHGPSYSQTNLELWHGLTGIRAEAMTRLVEGFNTSQSDYRMQAVFKDTHKEFVTDLVGAHRAGRAPHLVHLDQASGQMLSTHRNVIRPVQLVIQEAAPRAKLPRYLPGVIEASKDTLGRVVSLPLGASSVALFVNQDLLAKAGVAPNTTFRTWKDLQDAALRIIDSESAGCAFASDRQAWVLIENVLAMHDQSFLETAGPFSQVSKLNFSNRLLIRHVGMLASWHSSGIFSYFGPHGEASERFASGECAMLAGPSSLYPRLAAGLGKSLTMQPLPIYDDITSPHSRSLSTANSLWVLAGKARQDYKGVGLFLAHLSRPEIQAQWHQSTGDLPLTAEAYEMSRKSGFYERNRWAEVPIRSTDAAVQARAIAPSIPQLGKIREILDSELEEVWARHKTPKEAMDDASERGTRLLHGK